MSDGCIYFLREGTDGNIKIGYSLGLEARRKDLQTGNSQDLVLLAVLAGTTSDERQLHTKYGHLHIRGEWFRPAPELLAHIESINPRKTSMSPTKRQVARVIRKAAKLVPQFPRMSKALLEVCKKHGGRASDYYDLAALTLKVSEGVSFTSLVNLPSVVVQRKMRRAARALEHGLSI